MHSKRIRLYVESSHRIATPRRRIYAENDARPATLQLRAWPSAEWSFPNRHPTPGIVPCIVCRRAKLLYNGAPR